MAYPNVHEGFQYRAVGAVASIAKDIPADQVESILRLCLRWISSPGYTRAILELPPLGYISSSDMDVVEKVLPMFGETNLKTWMSLPHEVRSCIHVCQTLIEHDITRDHVEYILKDLKRKPEDILEVTQDALAMVARNQPVAIHANKYLTTNDLAPLSRQLRDAELLFSAPTQFDAEYSQAQLDKMHSIMKGSPSTVPCDRLNDECKQICTEMTSNSNKSQFVFGIEEHKLHCVLLSSVIVAANRLPITFSNFGHCNVDSIYLCRNAKYDQLTDDDTKRRYSDTYLNIAINHTFYQRIDILWDFYTTVLQSWHHKLDVMYVEICLMSFPTRLDSDTIEAFDLTMDIFKPLPVVNLVITSLPTYAYKSNHYNNNDYILKSDVITVNLILNHIDKFRSLKAVKLVLRSRSIVTHFKFATLVDKCKANRIFFEVYFKKSILPDQFTTTLDRRGNRRLFYKPPNFDEKDVHF
tara:strand:+ start:1327 stop:2730 length:1404 start_codon:yes stop_codon:yes gene_type:complete